MEISEILEALKAIVDGAAGRDLTDEEAQRYEKLEADLAVARRSAEIRNRQQAYETPVGDLAAVVHVGTPKPDDGLDKAFDSYLRTGRPNADLAELRNDQSIGTPSEGGYLVPESFRQKLVDRMKAFGGIANVVETITTSDGRTLPWPTVDDTSNVGEIVSEGGTFSSGADLVFDTAALGAYSYMAGGGGSTPLRLSYELLQDSAFDVQGLVSRKLGERIARIQAVHWVNGTGSGMPKGIVHGKTGVQIADDGDGITYADLIDFIHAVDPAYRDSGRCRWAFNDKTLALIEKLVDTNGDPLWRPITGTIGDSPSNGRLLGYPVTIDQQFPDFDADNNTVNWGAFGDFQEGYVIRRVRSVEILVNPFTRMANRQIEFTAWARADAVPQNPHAYVALTGEA